MTHCARAGGAFLPVAAAAMALMVVIGLLQPSAQREVLIEIAPAAPVRLRAGDPAPNFCLKTAAGDRTVELAELRGQKPVALIFGSFT